MKSSAGHRGARLALATMLVAAGITVAGVDSAAADDVVISQQNLLVPAGSESFGKQLLVLRNGNYVVTDPNFDIAGADDVGAVHLYDGADHTLISTLTGSSFEDSVGSGGVVEVGANGGNFVVSSRFWNRGSVTDAGAATWIDGDTGLDGAIDETNSLVGSRSGDQISANGFTVLTNGNYVVSSPSWSSSTTSNVGASTWGNGDVGVAGAVSTANSLHGVRPFDKVGDNATALANGNYVVGSPQWRPTTRSDIDTGAVTWASGTSRTVGAVTTANSIYGREFKDRVGDEVVALSNGNYVIVVPRQGEDDIHTVAFAKGDGPSNGKLDIEDSVLSRGSDAAGSVTPLTNGNYVVRTESNGERGRVTWVNGATGGDHKRVNGKRDDRIGSGGILALTNGNFVVLSPDWQREEDDDEEDDDDDDDVVVGAATWGSGTAGLTEIDEANSFIGEEGEPVATNGVALRNGNYVISSPEWGEGGAVTWSSGRMGRTGRIAQSNSLYGDEDDGRIGGSSSEPGVVALADGDYVITSPDWDGDSDDVGLAVWVNGARESKGLVDERSGLTGSTKGDRIGSSGVVALQNGRFVVNSPQWDRGNTADAGAVTWANGSSPLPPSITDGNSFVGTRTNDLIGIGGVMPLLDQGFAFGSPRYDTNDSGAVTRVGGAGGSGELTSTNSAFGSAPRSVMLPEQRFTADGSIVASAGNSVLILRPETPPEFVEQPDDISVTAERGDTRIDVDFALPAATDEQSTPTVECDPAPGSSFRIGTTTVRCIATDSAGLTATTSFRVTVTAAADGPPTIEPASDVSAVADVGETSAVVTFPTPTATDAESTPTVACTPPSGTTFDLGTTVVTCTATDSIGETDTTSFDVTVLRFPDDPPTFTEQPDDVVVIAAPGELRAVVTFDLPPATDDKSTPTVACDRQSGSLFDIGVFTVNCTATDSVGLEDRVAFTVTVSPATNGAPTFDAAPSDVTVQAEIGSDGATVTYALPNASDDESDPSVECFPASGSVFAVGDTTVDCTATDSFGLTATVSFTVTVRASQGEVPDVDDVIPVEPARLVDTRPNNDTVDGMFRGGGPFGAGRAIEVDVIGRGGVGLAASAALVNVTAINPSGKGFATAYACNDALPFASSLNFDRGVTVANSTLVPLSAAGRMCVYTSASTNVAVDVIGYVPTGSSVGTNDPARLFDSRPRPDGATVDGLEAGQGVLVAGVPVEVQVAGRGGIPGASTGALLNLTAINPTGKGFVTLYPCSDDVPNTSSLNVEAGQNIANATMVQLSPNGTACVVVSVDMHLAIDAVGSAGPASELVTVAPARLLDTRSGTGAQTVDGLSQSSGRLAVGEVIEVQITGRGNVPDDADGAMLNLTAINPADGGFATLYPCSDEPPNASAINYLSGGNIANSTFVQLSEMGKVCIFTSATSHYALDVVASVSSDR